jgi:hypothetical protein
MTCSAKERRFITDGRNVRPHSQLSKWKSPGALSPGANRSFHVTCHCGRFKAALTRRAFCCPIRYSHVTKVNRELTFWWETLHTFRLNSPHYGRDVPSIRLRRIMSPPVRRSRFCEEAPMTTRRLGEAGPSPARGAERDASIRADMPKVPPPYRSARTARAQRIVTALLPTARATADAAMM